MGKKNDITRYLVTLCAFLWLIVLPPVSYSANYDIDTSSNAPITGLWWNALESGWGVTLTQQYEVIFVTIFTYDASGMPIWYVASNCIISGDSCSGELYKVSGGNIVTGDWANANIKVDTVGGIGFTFIDDDTATMNFTIDGVDSSKWITRQVWSTLSPGAPLSALWWNELESGWGVTLTQQTDIAFATIFTYDANGFPTWFVASNCSVSGSDCTGELYSVTGGSPLTTTWNGDNLIVTPVGEIEMVTFGLNSSATSFDIDGVFGSKTLARQVWALDDDGDEVSNNFDAYPTDSTRSAYNTTEVAEAALSALGTQAGNVILIAIDKGYSLRQIIKAILANTLSLDGDITNQSPTLTPQSLIPSSMVGYRQLGTGKMGQAVANDHPAFTIVEAGGVKVVWFILEMRALGYTRLQIIEAIVLVDWAACNTEEELEAKKCIASMRTSKNAVGRSKFWEDPRILAETEVVFWSDDINGMPSSCDTNEGFMTFTGSITGVIARYGDDQGRIVGYQSHSSYPWGGQPIAREILRGYWVEADSNEECSTPKDGSYHWGRIFATIPDSINDLDPYFDGRWGYCENDPTEDWTGTCQP